MKTRLTAAGQWIALRNGLIAALLVLTAGLVAAQSNDVELNPGHPDTYVVKRGDTLWDISGMFLKDPWYWPEIWYVNPQVENPHLIYPGDVLTLVYVDGQPRLQLARGSAGSNSVGVTGGTDRLSPTIRSENLDSAISTISYNVIEPFLSGGMVMDKDEVDSLPYIVALRDHLVAGAGHEVYVENMPADAEVDSQYSILRIDDKLTDPETGKLLGYEILFIGTAQLRAKGDPSTLFLTDTDREAYKGDLIRKIDMTLPLNFFPSAPTQQVEGQIISVIDGVSRIGQYQMVMLNRGTSQGLDAGSVMSVWQTGKSVRDNVKTSFSFKEVDLPDTFAGNVMVVKAYEDISYALVMEAVSEMRVNDRVENP